MRKLIVLFCVCVCLSSLTFAAKPQWMVKMPSPKNGSYLYEMGRGVGYTESEARNRAMGLVYRNTMERLGLYINMASINEAIVNGTVYGGAEAMEVPIRKVCEYIEYQDQQYIVHVLCQVAKFGNIYPSFTSFTDCNKLAMSQYIGYSFVPGMAQIKKGCLGKGVGFIVGEIAAIGGIVTTECLHRYYEQQIHMTSKTQLKQFYLRNANICKITRNVCIGGAAAVYVWNVIDGIVAKEKTQIPLGVAQLRLTPYADGESGGLAAVVNF